MTLTQELTSQIDRVCIPMHGGAHDHDDLLDAVGDRSIVMLGEATHGTHEFYSERARITARLIEERGFTGVAGRRRLAGRLQGARLRDRGLR